MDTALPFRMCRLKIGSGFAGSGDWLSACGRRRSEVNETFSPGSVGALVLNGLEITEMVRHLPRVIGCIATAGFVDFVKKRLRQNDAG